MSSFWQSNISLAAPGGETTYHYSADRELDRITKPDGQTLDFGHDSAGRLQTLSTPDGTATYSYHPTTGHLSQIAAADATLAYTYSGGLLAQTQWTGAVQGSVNYAYDNDFRVNEIKVNGEDPISYGYDADGLLTTAGALTLTRDAQNGLLTATALGQTGDSRTYTVSLQPNH